MGPRCPRLHSGKPGARLGAILHPWGSWHRCPTQPIRAVSPQIGAVPPWSVPGQCWSPRAPSPGRALLAPASRRTPAAPRLGCCIRHSSGRGSRLGWGSRSRTRLCCSRGPCRTTESLLPCASRRTCLGEGAEGRAVLRVKGLVQAQDTAGPSNQPLSYTSCPQIRGKGSTPIPGDRQDSLLASRCLGPGPFPLPRTKARAPWGLLQPDLHPPRALGTTDGNQPGSSSSPRP